MCQLFIVKLAFDADKIWRSTAAKQNQTVARNTKWLIIISVILNVGYFLPQFILSVIKLLINDDNLITPLDV